MRFAAAAAVLGLPVAAVSACPAFDNPRELLAADAASPPAFFEVGPVPVSAPFELYVQVCGPDRSGVIELDFDALMPAHQHGMNYFPEVEEQGPGVFRISNVVFHMPGLWELRVGAYTDAGRHAYIAEVDVE